MTVPAESELGRGLKHAWHGKVIPKTGKVVPPVRRPAAMAINRQTAKPQQFAERVAAALHQELGATHVAVKTAAGWTGANERTVKDWPVDTSGPAGERKRVVEGKGVSVGVE